MFRLIAFLAVSYPLLAQPTCSGLTLVEQAANSLTYRWTANATVFYARIRFGLAAVTEKTMGLQEIVYSAASGDPITMHISGLEPATTYQIGAAASVDGASWCTDLTTSQATAAALTEEQKLPALPVNGGWDPNIAPAQTPGTTYHITTCAGAAMHTALTAAVPGDTIEGDPGVVCDIGDSAQFPSTIAHFNEDGRAGSWIGGLTCSSTTERCTKTAHGLSDESPIYFASQHENAAPRPLNYGIAYYVKTGGSCTGGSCSANEFEISETAGGSRIDLTTNGAELLYKTSLTCTNPIIIRTAGAASLFPPAGVRMTAAPSLFILKARTTGTRSFDLSWGAPACVRFENIEFRMDNGAANGTVDPITVPIFANMVPFNHDIVFDRVRPRGPGYPNRIGSFMRGEGTRIALINFYAENILVGSPWHNLTVAFTTTQISWGSGNVYRGSAAPCPISGMHADITGGTATAKTVWASASETDCTITVRKPSTLTMTCTGCTLLDDDTAASKSCGPQIGDTTAANNGWPLTGGRYAETNISCATVTSNQFSAHTSAISSSTGCCAYMGSGITEASASFFFQNYGPGPTIIENGACVNCSGILIYFPNENGDSTEGPGCPPTTCPLRYQPADITVRRVKLTLDDEHIPSAASFAGRWMYGGRNWLEWKVGQRILAEGNIISGNIKINNDGPVFVFTPLTVTAAAYASGVFVSDATVRYNTVDRSSVFMLVTAKYPRIIWASKYPTRRLSINDNLVSTDGSLRAAFVGVSDGSGSFASLFGGLSDVRFENNTLLQLKGGTPLTVNHGFGWFNGMIWRNNILVVNDDNSYRGARYSDSTPTNPTDVSNAKDSFDRRWMPSYTFANNGFLGAYLTGSTEMNQSQVDTVRTAYGALTSSGFWAAGASIAARQAAIVYRDMTAGNYRLRYNSPFFRLGTTGGDLGANIDALEQAQGLVTGISGRLTAATTFDVSLTAPGSSSTCYAEISTDQFSTFTRITLTGTGRRKSGQFTSLPSNTPYQWRVYCETGVQVGQGGGFRTP